MAETITLPDYSRDNLAGYISDRWVQWDSGRHEWNQEMTSVRQFIFATDTRKTENKKLPWKNSTVTPKLTQLRDNLHANYIAALFPTEDWFDWRFAVSEEEEGAKAEAIKGYMKTKFRESEFEVLVSRLILDYIDYGNVFVGHEWTVIKKVSSETEGQEEVLYKGPKAYRISPHDIVFNPRAKDFKSSPKIIRTLKSYGQFLKEQRDNPNPEYDQEVIGQMNWMRTSSAEDRGDVIKDEGYTVDGFGSLHEYYESDMVEFLEFYGDVYDSDTGTLHTDVIITVVDRRWVLAIKENDHWEHGAPIFHVGWRLRPDNLWAQGPLAQLLGMQYRIDHLENLKADVYDQIALPVTVIKGDMVDDFEWYPGAQIHVGPDGDVDALRPDATALTADTQIQRAMDLMEELAGAPRQAMGIRTPGEKTKYEVQVLENGAGRIFQNKTVWFEKNLLEPLMNSMFAEAVQNVGNTRDTTISVTDQRYGQEVLKSISRDDIKSQGRLYPVGARHFAEKAKFVQDLTQTLQIINQDPSVKAHWSGLRTAKALEENLGFTQWNIVQKNIGVSEQVETQRAVNMANEQLSGEAAADPTLTPEDTLDETGTQEALPEGGPGEADRGI